MVTTCSIQAFQQVMHQPTGSIRSAPGFLGTIRQQTAHQHRGVVEQPYLAGTACHSEPITRAFLQEKAKECASCRHSLVIKRSCTLYVIDFHSTSASTLCQGCSSCSHGVLDSVQHISSSALVSIKQDSTHPQQHLQQTPQCPHFSLASCVMLVSLPLLSPSVQGCRVSGTPRPGY